MEVLAIDKLEDIILGVGILVGLEVFQIISYIMRGYVIPRGRITFLVLIQKLTMSLQILMASDGDLCGSISITYNCGSIKVGFLFICGSTINFAQHVYGYT